MPTLLAQTSGGIDFVNENGLLDDDGLETAVILSLFQDARATDDELAEAGLTKDQNRGWWGDTFPEIDGDVEGSKLWLLARALKTPESLAQGQAYAEDALAWLVEDEVALSVTVTTGWLDGSDIMTLSVEILRKDVPRWQRVWAAVGGELLEAA